MNCRPQKKNNLFNRLLDIVPTDDYISNRIFLSAGIREKEVCMGYSEESSAAVLIALLVAYVIVLGIGVVAEIWHIEWILNLPLYKL